MQLSLFPMPSPDRDEQIAEKVQADLDYGTERDGADFPEDE